MGMKRRDFVKAGVAIGGAMIPLQSILARRAFGLTPQGAPLPGNMIPQFVGPLPDLNSGIMVLNGSSGNELTLTMGEFQSQVLPTGMPRT